MQEEVENKTLTLVVNGTKFTGRLFTSVSGSTATGMNGNSMTRNCTIF